MTSLLTYTERQSFPALIFDCDGTLANTTPVHYRTFSEAFAEHGHTFEQFARKFGLAFDKQVIANRMRQLFFGYVDQVEGITQVTEMTRRHGGEGCASPADDGCVIE